MNVDHVLECDNATKQSRDLLLTSDELANPVIGILFRTTRGGRSIRRAYVGDAFKFSKISSSRVDVEKNPKSNPKMVPIAVRKKLQDGRHPAGDVHPDRGLPHYREIHVHW